MSPAKPLAVFTQDVGIKVMALVGAVLLWAVVTFLGSRAVTIEDVPVTVVNLPSDLGVGEDLPPVTVRLRVPRTLSVESTADLVRAFVDLGGSGLGAHTVPVTATTTRAGVDLVGVEPATLRVTLDPVVERTVPVNVLPSGTPAEGFRIGEVRADPERVQVRAPLKKFEKLGSIEAPVSVEGGTSTFDGEVPLRVVPGAQVAPDRVKVRVVIEQSEGVKTVGIRVVTKGSPAAGYWVRAVMTDPATATVRGVREAIAGLATLETSPVDVAGARDRVETPVTLVLPEGLEVEPRGQTFRATVDIVPLEGTKEVTVAVAVSDVPEGLRVTAIAPATLRVTVRGEGEVYHGLRGEDVRITVSAAGRERGTLTVRPKENDVVAPGGVRVVSVEQRDVSVTLDAQ